MILAFFLADLALVDQNLSGLAQVSESSNDFAANRFGPSMVLYHAMCSKIVGFSEIQAQVFDDSQRTRQFFFTYIG